MLLLTVPFIPREVRTVWAVVVPPGMLSPITKQSVVEPKLLPIILPYSTARVTSSSDIAGSSVIFLPYGRPVSKHGSCGEILLPAFITTFGMLADSSAVFVKSAGVGLPSGVIGIAFMHLQ